MYYNINTVFTTLKCKENINHLTIAVGVTNPTITVQTFISMIYDSCSLVQLGLIVPFGVLGVKMDLIRLLELMD